MDSNRAYCGHCSYGPVLLREGDRCPQCRRRQEACAKLLEDGPNDSATPIRVNPQALASFEVAFDGSRSASSFEASYSTSGISESTSATAASVYDHTAGGSMPKVKNTTTQTAGLWTNDPLAGKIESGKSSVLNEYLFDRDAPWTPLEHVLYPARIRIPGELPPFHRDTLGSTTNLSGQPTLTQRRGEGCQPRVNGACDACRRGHRRVGLKDLQYG